MGGDDHDSAHFCLLLNKSPREASLWGSLAGCRQRQGDDCEVDKGPRST